MAPTEQQEIQTRNMRMQTGLLAIQAYQNKQMASKMAEVSAAVKAQTAVQEQIAQLQAEQVDEARKQTVQLEMQTKLMELDRAEKQKEKIVRQAIFEANESLGDLEAESNFVLKLAKLYDIQGQVETHEISPALVDSMDEKTYVSDFLKALAEKTTAINSTDDAEEKSVIELYAELSAFDRPIAELVIPEEEATLRQRVDDANDYISQIESNGDKVPSGLSTFLKANVTKKELSKFTERSLFKAIFMAFVSIAFFGAAVDAEEGQEAAAWVAGALSLLFAYMTVKRIRRNMGARTFWLRSKNNNTFLTFLTAVRDAAHSELSRIDELTATVGSVNDEIEELNAKLAALSEKYESIDVLFPTRVEPVDYSVYLTVAERAAEDAQAEGDEAEEKAA